MSTTKQSKTSPNDSTPFDIMETNTAKIIKKYQSTIPTNYQHYSTLSTNYLETLSKLSTKNCQSEKKLFKKLDIKQEIPKSVHEYSDTILDLYLEYIDYVEKYRNDIIQMQKSYLKIYENTMNVMIDSFENWFQFFNA